MKVITVIPARYSLTRLPGKPLADICGKPMIYWVYNNVKKSKKTNEIYVATDDNRIKKVCDEYGMNFIMTSSEHAEHISRIWEVSNSIKADYYICVNGDEPLIDYKNIDRIIPKKTNEVEYFRGAFRKLTDPSETIDSANIKLVLADDGRCIYMSRTPIPYPKNNLLFNYNKYVGIECFTKKGLDMFHNTSMGLIEKTEDIDHIRFLENNKSIYFKEVKSSSISVDTKKDLEKVRLIMKEKLKKEGI